MNELLKYKSVQYWLEGLKQRTRSNYLADFPKFLEHVKMTPDEIIETRRQDLLSSDKQTQKRWEHIVKTWYHEAYESFEKAGKSTSTPHTWLRTVLSFFSRNDYPLHFRKKELRQPKKKLKMVPITIDDVKAIYVMTESIRDKAMLTTLVQSGLAEVDVCALRVEQFPIEKLKKPPLYLEGYRSKTDVPYQTCIGADACIDILKLLKLRDYPKEGYLFLSVHGEPMTPRFVREALNSNAEKSEVKDFQVKHLRDLFHDALSRAGLSREVKDRMMGWELSGAKRHYMLSQYTIVEAYQKAYVYLTINGETRHSSSDQAMKTVILKLAQIIASDDPRQAILDLIKELKAPEPAKPPELEAVEVERAMKEPVDLATEFVAVIRKYLESL